MDDEEIQSQIVRFLVEHQRVRESKIKKETRIENDLGITGDDAMEFMEAFFETFQVDFSAFRFDDHFSPEACWPWEIFKRPPGRQVTVHDLVTVARLGKWKLSESGC